MKKDIAERKDIELLLNSFYDKVRRDEVIGYIFTEIVRVDWEHHIPVICDFWENILFQTTGFTGNPIATHIKLHALTPLTRQHFDRWVQLFTSTVDEHFIGNKAIMAKQRALSIATMMKYKILENSGQDLLNKPN